MARFKVEMVIEAEGLTAESVEEILTEEIRHYGDFHYEIKVVEEDESV